MMPCSGMAICDVVFGLGSHAQRVKLETRWPDGHRQQVETQVDRTLVVSRQ